MTAALAATDRFVAVHTLAHRAIHRDAKSAIRAYPKVRFFETNTPFVSIAADTMTLVPKLA